MLVFTIYLIVTRAWPCGQVRTQMYFANNDIASIRSYGKTVLITRQPVFEDLMKHKIKLLV